MAGLYKMLTKKERFYRVELPALIKIHSVFLAKSLCYNPNNLLPSQANAPPPLVNVTADNEYKV
jgi:hypothetical protein